MVNDKDEQVEPEYKLKDWEIQQLVEDIEKEGGRKADNGKLIYDANPNIYGAQGSTKRTAFRWKKNNLRRQSIQHYWKESIIGRQVSPHPITLSEYQAFSKLLSAKATVSTADMSADADAWEDEIHPDDTGSGGGGSNEVRFKKIGDVEAPKVQVPPSTPSTPAPRPAQRSMQASSVVRMAPMAPAPSTPANVPSQVFRSPRPALPRSSASSVDDSLVDSFSALSVSGTALPWGDGSKENPIYAFVNWKCPERNHGFCVHAFPNMLCEGRTRNVIEIAHSAELCDLQGS